MMHIVIIGGGVSGLFAARKLLSNNHKVTIIETNEVLGGLASSFKIKNKYIPKTYHHFLPNETIMLKLLRELKLYDKLIWNKSSICFWFKNRPFKLTSPADIIFFKPFDWLSKIKLARLGVLSFIKRNWSDLKGRDAESWVRKIVGNRVTENLFKPLAKIKFGELSSVSAAWFGERLHEAAINKEEYAYLSCGLQAFIDEIGEDVKRKGGKIHLSSTVTKIDGDNVHAIVNGKEKKFIADKVVSSLPPPILSRITRLTKSEQKILEKIEYKPLVCMVAGSKELITPFYWNVFIKPKMSFGGIFHHTALYPEGGVDGENLYYFFTYLDEDHPLYSKSEKEIESVYLKDIQKICPSFKYSWTRVFKIKYSSPIYSMNYENLPIKINNKLYLTGVFRMYPSTRTMNTAAKSGLITADFILQEANFINK